MQSSAARAFSILSSKIHPQLPLTPRESEQLLALLTSSFRRHLREQPGIATPDLAATASRPQQPSKHGATSRASISAGSSHTPTSRLLESILVNPLLAHKPSRQHNHQKPRQITWQWFRDRIADGSASLPTARRFAETMRHSPNATADSDFSLQKPGTEIAQWLWASGLETTGPFLVDYRLHDNLVALLIREDNERRLWRWFGLDFTRSLQSAGVTPSEISQFHNRLLKAIVLYKMGAPGGVEAAMSAHLHACSIAIAGLTASAGTNLQEFFLAGAAIINHIHATSTTKSVSPLLYDRFVDSVHIWCKKPTGFKALLHLFHPSRPTLEPALQYLRTMADVLSELKASRYRVFVVNLSLDLARALHAEERVTEGLWVIDFLKDKFPQEVGWKESATSAADYEYKPKISNDELENLRLLETLDIGSDLNHKLAV